MSSPFQKGNFARTIQVPSSSSPERRTYLFNDDPSLIDLAALNAAFASPLIWWASTLSSLEQLQSLVQNSYCFGLYLLPPSEPNSSVEQDEKRGPGEMIGFARLITDYVTFAYLTDVYVIEEHQGQGLAKFMMKGMNDVLSKWPDLRRGMLITNSGSGAEGVYRRIFGAIDLRERDNSKLPPGGSGGLIAMEWRYPKSG